MLFSRIRESSGETGSERNLVQVSPQGVPTTVLGPDSVSLQALCNVELSCRLRTGLPSDISPLATSLWNSPFPIAYLKHHACLSYPTDHLIRLPQLHF